jgi:high-affinity Fe2+/Pb2+ permease
VKFTLGLIVGGLLVWGWSWFTEPHTMRDAHDRGYADGYKKALKTTPASHELEMACVSLWFGGKGEEYWKLKRESK